jgi:L-aspartate oxidase
MPQRYTHDVLVIGSGAAGLSVALQVSGTARVAVICKGELGDGSTSWAQGGIAAVLDDEDTIDSHVADTLRAGAGLCHEDMVRFTVEHSRESIQWLVDLGVGFTKLVTPGGENEFHLTMEGGHSHRRIIHAADATGRAVSDTLIE